MYMDETSHISNFLVTNLYYNGEIRVEKGKGKWIRIINIIIVHILVATCLNETKKGVETSKSK